MWKQIFLMSATFVVVFGATLYHCQDGSTCQLPGDHIEATNFEFLGKLSQKQTRTVVSLKMSNASINKLDPKLKYLKNLKYLDLSYNNIQISSIPPFTKLKTLKLNANNLKYINITSLPKNIEVLDISHNLLVQIPRDWRSLSSLKVLHLYKNPVDCDCNNVLTYDGLIKNGILVPEVITCHSPKKYIGKDINSVNCSIDDIMLYDEPDIGSGDVPDEPLVGDGSNIPIVHESDDENVEDNNTFINDEDELIASGTQENTDDLLGHTLEEGSGEGSGAGGLFDTGILGCIENCSTPGPVGVNDEEHASPLPSAVDQARIILEDINLLKGESTTQRTTTTTTVTSVVEPEIVKKEESPVKASPRHNDVEVLSTDTNTGELERASTAPQNSTAVYAIVGVGLFLAVVFIICFIKKRNSKKRSSKNREVPNALAEEMKPLKKSANDKPLFNSSNIPEHVPLINGQNGKPKDDAPVLKSFTPLAHPETLPEEEEPEQENLQKETPDDVEFRKKSAPELLTPPRERVTIKETEILDSIPKTPLLVHRQRNSDGEIVTTVVP